MMETLFKFTDVELSKYVKDDPVRPHLCAEFRTTYNCEAFGLVEEDEVKAIICVADTRSVPKTETELTTNDQVGDEHVIVPYTVWSYSPGAGRRLVNAIIDMVRKDPEDKEVKPRIVTLSPKTDMAERFHINNGARYLSNNKNTNNFEYLV